ncbi:hypothetical protein ANN_15243, partial [Periplaneta americana]
LREKWLNIISREGDKRGSKWIPSDRSCVCSLHFKQEDFKEDTKYRKLKNLSIPSIFPGYPSYKKPCNKRKRKVRNSSSSSSEKNKVSTLSAQCQEDIEAEYREKEIDAGIIKDKADVNVDSDILLFK